jgi:tetratricopeptide (TPR) repeat protein
MKKLMLIILIIGCNMTASANSNLPDFDKLWNFNKPAETELKFREILSTLEITEAHDYKFQLLTQIARTQGLQRKFDDAHLTLDGVQVAISVTTIVAEIRYYLERGRVFNSSKKKEMALPNFLKSYELAVARKQDNLAVDAAHMMAIVESLPENQMDWNLKALKLAEASSDQKAQDWLGSLYNNIGWTYHDSGKFNEALEMFNKALEFRKKKTDQAAIRVAKWCVARAFRSLNKIDEALDLQKSLELEFDNLSEKDGYVYEELGELYLLKQMKTEFQKYFALAYQELSKDEWFKANETKRLDRIKELGGVK